MKHSIFNKKRLAVCISAVLATGLSSQLYAEEAVTDKVNSSEKDAAIEVIQVTGIMSSLSRSMSVKRNASGVVDVISAEDMGKFPDTNLAESLQRITGVSVSRSNGEGSQITVRGFGPEFNLITLNGRQMPGTGNSRSYSLENLSSDGVSAIEVHKTARAENPSGGLGATVNIITMKPFASPGEKFVLSGKGIYDSSNVEGDDVTPEFSGLYSNTFADDTFGFALSFSHQQRDFQQQSANIQGWQFQPDAQLPTLDDDKVIDNRDANAAAGAFFPRDMNYGIANVERERTNANVTFQYAPIESVIMTLDYTMGESTTGTNSIGWGQWHDFGGNIDAYELDENGTVIFADLSGNDGSYTANRNTTETNESSLGFNVEWRPSDDFVFSVDYHSSENKADNGKDKGMNGTGSLVFGSDQLVNKHYDFRQGDIPQGTIFWKNGSTTLAPSEIDSHFSQFEHTPGKSEIDQLQIDGSWENPDDSSLKLVKFGVARTEQTMGGSRSWSGLIGGFLFNPNYSAAFPDGMFEYNTTDGFLDEFSNGDNPMGAGYYYSFDFDEAVARSAYYLNSDVLGDDFFSTDAYRPGSVQSQSSVDEDTTSVYASSLFEFEVAELPVQVNVGFRYEQTDVTSNVLQPIPTEVWWKGGSEWLTQYQPGENTILSLEGEHDVFLPMIDAKIDLSEELVARASWGKTIARAPLGSLAGGRSLGASTRPNSRIGGEGNTNLDPYESTNLDISLEYYYAEGSYAAIGYFRKDVKNFISSQTITTSVDDMRDIYQGPRWNQAVSDLGGTPTSDEIFAQMQANGATLNAQGFIEPAGDDPLMQWDITRPFNAPDDKMVDGIEVAVQHFFGESGFGFGANATFVDGDVKFDVDDITKVDSVADLKPQTPLTGLSDSANFQLFYEKEGLSVKVTYAWRDEYLIGVGQAQGSSDAPPQFAKEFGQVDMSINYDIDENFTVFVEGLNLNNETEQSFGRYEEQFLSARQYGTRYTVGVRYSFK
ncbi:MULTISPECIES: TonB-dependent receptor [unclassified Colwellia]|jgi:iron complex outermembrane receptor protein|uniref:TonB-dependent receptor n=1 Tax=unclassified Colwellia TaxID=196834 RepID=UPI0015F3FF88|nr:MULTISPECIES: TonB-dependent receptor [unclassified Colwellia]MBA6252696.1 TonB-dependent receptor [Colwellia sp. MB3u-55]MBA6396794.1 TonB-dependent receptor [Colwellia sp. BRX10-4]